MRAWRSAASTRSTTPGTGICAAMARCRMRASGWASSARSRTSPGSPTCATRSRSRERLGTRGIEGLCPPNVESKSALEAKRRYDVSAFIFDHVGTLRALERRLGVFVAQRGGLLVIGFGGAGILRSAAPTLCKRAHALQCAGMILRRRLFEQRPRRNVVLRSADALRNHQAELILRFG